MCAMIEKLRMNFGSAGMKGRVALSGARLRARVELARTRRRGYGQALLLRGLRRTGGVQAHLARQDVLVVLEHEVDALADVDGDRHLGPLVEQSEAIRLLRRD